jgi:hypothetical protein
MPHKVKAVSKKRDLSPAKHSGGDSSDAESEEDLQRLEQLALESADDSSSSSELAWVRELSPHSFSKLERRVKKEQQLRRPAKISSTSSSPYASFEEEEKEKVDEERLRLVLSRPARSLSAGEDIIGYKAVNLSIKGLPAHGIQALLRLRIPFGEASVYNVEGNGKVARPADMQQRQKYCTNLAYVEALQIGAPNPIDMKKALFALQTGNATLDAKYNSKFKYRLQEYASEPEAGRGCGQGQCGSGIYFYLQRSNTFNYFPKFSEKYVISDVVDKALLLSERTEHEDNAENEMLEEAHQHRIQDLAQWSKENIGSDVDIVAE